MGANAGDEGKGHLVDYFASSGEYSTVVRFNGGPQAGHTVELEGNKRFIFSQLGSGSLRGLNTHLSRFMLVNPIYFMREYNKFQSEFGIKLKVTMDHQCEIITPWDVARNQNIEKRRRENAHGSVGHGIFEATKRAYEISLTAERLAHISSAELSIVLRDVARFHNLPFVPSDFNQFTDALVQMFEVVNSKRDATVIEQPCIFEGAQGLLLDKDSGMFPYVTPSHTGLTNVVALLSECDIQQAVRPVYVTRSYLTRHGPGPMYYPWVQDAHPFYEEMRPGWLDDDHTNHYNEWQGYLRYGELSVTQLHYSIMKDMYPAQRNTKVNVRNAHVAMTWANFETNLNPCKFVGMPWKLKYESHGKTSNHVKEINET